MNFDEIERLIDAGQGSQSTPLQEREVLELAEEVRLGCTQAMLGALDPAQRITYILSDIFELASRDAAVILGISPANFRKRLERARANLAGFMERKCGLVNPVVACLCVRQIPVASEHRLLDPDRLRWASLPRARHALPVVEAWEELTRIDRAARVFRERATELAPAALVTEIRELITSDRFRLLRSS